MAAHRKQACVFKHPQNEDVSDSGCESHGIWSYTWYFQSPVSINFYLDDNIISTCVAISRNIST